MAPLRWPRGERDRGDELAGASSRGASSRAARGALGLGGDDRSRALPVAARMAAPGAAPRRRAGLLDGDPAGLLRHDRPGQAGPRPADRARQPDPPAGDRRRRPRARRRLHRRARARPATRGSASPRSSRRFLADLEARSLAEGGLFLDLDYEARERGLHRRARLLATRPRRLGGGGGDPVHRLLRRGQRRRARPPDDRAPATR